MTKKKSLINKTVSLVFVMSMLAMTLLPALSDNSSSALASSKKMKEHKKIIKTIVSEPTIEIYEGYQIPRIENYNSIDKPSVPMLPVKSFSLAIPTEAEIKNIKATYSKKRDLRGDFDVLPVQKPVPISKSDQSRFTPKNSSIYSSTDQFPGKLFEYSGEGNLRGQRILSINVYPLQYNPAAKKLTFYENIEIEVTYAHDGSQSSKSEKAGSDEFASMAKKIVSNPEDVEVSSVAPEEATGLLPLEDVKHVIITSDVLKDEFQVLADHKINRGVSSKVVTLEWITSNYDGIDNQEKIRNFIIDAKASWNTMWILLGGDTAVVPHRMAYSNFQSVNEYIPTDLYYSDLDGNWNADGDSIYGETTDDVDLYPDVFVGRAPVDTIAEASIFVDKTITYESGPSGYETSALFLAEYLDGSTDGGVTKNMIESESVPENFSVTKLYSSLGNLNNDSAVTELNKGYGIVNHIGHANYSVLSIGSGYLYRSDMDSLNNFPKSSVLYSEGCWSNALDRDSIAEHFILSSNGGGIAYAGNSRYGWYSPGSPGYGPSDRLDRAFFDSLFNKEFYDVGMTFADSKAVYVSSSTYDSVYRYLQYSLNLLGDPETTIWTVSVSEPPVLSVSAGSPDKVNTSTDFTVNAIISNSGTEMATGVNAKIVLPEGLSTTESTSKDLGDLGGKESKSVSWTVSADSNPGVYDITINASAENITGLASDITTVEVVSPDLIEPTITLYTPENNAEVNDNDTIIFQYIPEDEKSEIANCKLIIDGEIWQMNYEIVNGSENEFAIPWINAGAHTWSVSCVDDSLEMNEGFSEERTLTIIDTTPPMEGYIDIMDMGAVSASDGYTSDNIPDLYLGAYGANYMALSCDNTSFSEWIDFPKDKYYYIYSDFNIESGAGCIPGDGPKTVYVKFKDEAGNEGAFASDTTILDTIAPEITNITGDVSATTGDSLALSLTVSDAGEIGAAVIYIDGIKGIVMSEGPDDTFTYNYIVPANSIAPHSYYVIVYDLAENSSRSPEIETETYTITVTDNDAPIAIAGPDRSASIGEVMIFNASESSDNIGIENYNWDFGDGNSESEMIVDHIYTTAGTFTATLTVTDNGGMTATDTATITVNSIPNQPPIANAGPDQTVYDADGTGEETVFLNGSLSSDPDGEIISYTWSEGIAFVGSGPTPNNDFSIGTHIINLVVQDNDGATNSSTVTIEVIANQPPTANAGPDQTSVMGAVVSFDGSGSSDPDGNILSYEWDFDASNGIQVDAIGATAGNSYATAGSYTVTLTVTDNGEATATDTILVQVDAADAVNVTKAQFDSKKQILIVQATGSAGGDAILTVNGFGAMDYNADRNLFTLTVSYTENPGTITVSSSLGGAAVDVSVTNKFKK